MDFTVSKYRDLCAAIAESPYLSCTVDQAIQDTAIPFAGHRIVLRHDVDRFPRLALPLAEIESRHGLIASYYFRIPSSFNTDVIAAIRDMGHEIGLHYESLDKAKGDMALAEQSLALDLAEMRKVCGVRTVSMHGNPLSKHDNRDIWKNISFDDYDLNGEVYLSMDFTKFLYYSDTGRTWEDGKFNIKDVIPQGMERVDRKPMLKTTDDLVALIQSDDRNIYLLIHPERWTSTLAGWAASLGKDVVVNAAKVAYKFTLGNRS